LIEVVQTTEQLHKYMRFHAICGLDPRKVTPRLAKTEAYPIVKTKMSAN
jgi:hypothetical protein